MYLCYWNDKKLVDEDSVDANVRQQLHFIIDEVIYAYYMYLSTDREAKLCTSRGVCSFG
jgi:hypothetical protein